MSNSKSLMNDFKKALITADKRREIKIFHTVSVKTATLFQKKDPIYHALIE